MDDFDFLHLISVVFTFKLTLANVNLILNKYIVNKYCKMNIKILCTFKTSFLFIPLNLSCSSLPPAHEVETGFIFVAVQLRALGCHSAMSEEAKQTSAAAMDAKSDSTASPPPAQGVSSVSPPVSTVTQSAPPATEDEEEESEDESEILEESPCGRWQKRREEVPI